MRPASASILASFSRSCAFLAAATVPLISTGVGAALTQEAVRLARADGARTVDLTSRPSREAANRLYERLGFHLRDSKVYRHADG